jgi:hypothetical protein
MEEVEVFALGFGLTFGVLALAVEKGVELFTAGVGLGVSTYLGLRNREVKVLS